MDVKKQNSAGLVMVVAAAIASLAVSMADSPNWAPALTIERVSGGVMVHVVKQTPRPGFVVLEAASQPGGPWHEVARSEDRIDLVVGSGPSRFIRAVFVKRTGAAKQ